MKAAHLPLPELLRSRKGAVLALNWLAGRWETEVAMSECWAQCTEPSLTVTAALQ